MYIISKGNTGIPFSELSDCYNNVLSDIRELITNGQVIAIDNTIVGEKSTTVLYPRGPIFGTLLEVTPTSLSSSSSIFPATSSSHHLNHSNNVNNVGVITSCDLTHDILPGEALHVLPVVDNSSNTVCRVSSTRNGAKALPEDSLSSSRSFNRIYSVSLEQTLGSNLKSGVS